MQNLELFPFQGSREQVHEQHQQARSQDIVYQGHEHKEVGDGRKVSTLIIEDETKNYVDGIDDSSDGEPDSKIGRGVPEIRQKKTRGRVKIKMEFIENKLRRYTTFSKRKTGIMKKAYELSTLTGTQVMLLVASETGHVYTFATRKLQPMITSESGKALIQTCLNSPDPTPLMTQLASQNPSDQRMSQTGYEEPDLQYSAGDDEVKVQSSEGHPTVMTGIQLTQGGQGITSYVGPPASQPALNEASQQAVYQSTKPQATQPPTYSVQSNPGTVTAILAPGSQQTTANVGHSVQIHQSNVQPQIIQGQLQMHKIHPQNILLSGNLQGIQGSHIIINPAPLASQVVIAADQSNIQHVPASTATSAAHPPENIIIVPSGGAGELPQGPVQMIYNTPAGLVYASNGSIVSQSSSSVATTNSESVTIHHQPNSNSPSSSYHIHEGTKSGANLQPP